MDLLVSMMLILLAGTGVIGVVTVIIDLREPWDQ